MMNRKLNTLMRKIFRIVYRFLRAVVLFYLLMFMIMFVVFRYNGQNFPFDYLQGPDTQFAKDRLTARLPMLDQSKVKHIYGYRFLWTDEVVKLRFHYLDESVLHTLLSDFEKTSDTLPPYESKAWDKIPDAKPEEKYERLPSNLESETIWVDRNTNTVWYTYSHM